MLELAVRMEQQWEGMARARDGRVRAGLLDPEIRVRNGQELLARRLREQHLVQQREHVFGALGRPDRRRSQRVAGERGERGGVRALAADVSERDRPAAAAGLEDVVEVAADVVRLAGRPEARGDLEPGTSGRWGGRRLCCSLEAI